MFSAALDLGIDLNVWPWIWLGTAVLFALVELTLVGGSFIVLPFAVSAFIAAILAFYDVAVEIQWAVFVFGGAVLFALMYRWAQKFMKSHTMEPGVGADRLVGMHGTIITATHPDDHDRRGRVSIDGETWGVVDPDREFDIGQKVRVVAMKGTRVVVTALAPEPTLDNAPEPTIRGEE
ncbi:MAG: NfeD family protein [Ilumatobacteraceae bacterium]